MVKSSALNESPTVDGSTLVTVYYPTLLFLWVLVLGLDLHLSEGLVAFEMCLDPILGTHILDAPPGPECMG